MSRRDNFMFDMKTGDFYMRQQGGNCSECELPQDLCRKAKCKSAGVRYIWKQHNEIYQEYLKSLGLGPKEETKEEIPLAEEVVDDGLVTEEYHD